MKGEKAYFMEKLGKTNRVEIADSGCNFLTFRLRDGVTNPEEGLRERRIVIERFTDDEGTSFLRVPIRRHRENAQFAKTLIRIIEPRRPPRGFTAT